jgi:hypothetical protein
MKVGKRYHCFGCGESGDQIDYVGKLFGLDSLDSAKKICGDFGILYEWNRWKPQGAEPIKPKKTDGQIFKETQSHMYRVLSDYYHTLLNWEREYAPKSSDSEIHPYFVEAVMYKDHTEYLLDTMLFGDIHDRALLIADCGRRVAEIEKRFGNADGRGAA